MTLSPDILRPHADGKPREMIMRNGRRAWIHGRDDEAEDDQIVGFCIASTGQRLSWSWYINGHVNTYGDESYDLIAEAPREVEEWRVINTRNGALLFSAFGTLEDVFRYVGCQQVWSPDMAAILIRRSLDDGSINTIRTEKI